MKLAVLLVTAALGALAEDSKFVGGYLLMTPARNGHVSGIEELKALADNAATLPITRLIIGFFSPTMTYVQGSQTLQYAGLNVTDSGDYGFNDIKQAIAAIEASGIQVYLSVGGWNYNCFPYVYMKYSVGGYGPNTPNYWKIQKYGGGSPSGCTDDNQYCYVCEPPSEGTTLDSFSIFPEVSHSPVWQQAVQYVTQGAKGNQTPEWHPELQPGSDWTDPKTNVKTKVPGSNYYITQNRDPYQDLVYLASDLNCSGVDLDYEEFWHADLFKFGQGPWWLPQTVYKYAAIAKTLMIHIQNIKPDLKLSTAASAVGGWSSNWWGGNLKGVWYWTKLWYPEVIDFMSTGDNAGGINVMTYDLSDNPEFHECPQQGICTLSSQVDYYMKQYKLNGIKANVGYEIGTPAYPSPVHDPSHQLPLTHSELSSIVSGPQASTNGGFFWEMFKPTNSSDEASPTEVAQAICKQLLPGSPRCSGTIPQA